MKIIRFSANNVMKLKAVEITPDGATVIISGKNAAGKSSILNAIWLALGGGEASRNISEPIRKGEHEASVVLDLGEFTVRRTWSGDQTKLYVENAAGARFPSPQAMLDKLVGKLSFDPVAFAAMDDRKQVETLRQLTGLDFTEIERQYKVKYDERTEANRQAKMLEGQLKAINPPKSGSTIERIDVREVQAQLQSAADLNTQRNLLLNEQDSRRRGMDSWLTEISRLKTEKRRIEDAITLAHENVAGLENEIENLSMQAAAMVVPDVTALQDQLASAAEHNERVLEIERYAKTKKEHAAAIEQSSGLSLELDELLSEKATLLQSTPMPIEGLGFDAEQVLYNEVPFRQCSAAEQLRVSVSIAAALNPELRVIRVMDASLLDKDNMAVITQIAEEKDLQVWAERVMDEPDGVSIFIEDGSVKEVA